MPGATIEQFTRLDVHLFPPENDKNYSRKLQILVTFSQENVFETVFEIEVFPPIFYLYFFFGEIIPNFMKLSLAGKCHQNL
jgi:hypothetical protein